MHIPGRDRAATATAVAAATFVCADCGFTCAASVKAKGEGVARNVLYLDGESADRAARRRAHNDALNRAEAMLRIAPCPRCNRRSVWGVRLFVALTIAAALGLTVAGAYVGFLWESSTSVAIGALFGLIAATLYVIRRQALFHRAGHAIRFGDPAALAPKRRGARRGRAKR